MEAKFCVEHPWVGGTKVYSRDLDHMTKMDTTPIYGKTTQKSSPEPADRFPRGLQPITVCANDDPGMTLTYFTARSILETEAFTREKVKNYGFFENYCSLRPEKWQMQTTKVCD